MTEAIWNSRFETGIDLIDCQHKALFEAVNRLTIAFDSQDPGPAIKESLDFLATYVLDHFETEEHFMREMTFPGLEAHRAEHARLLIRVQILQGRLAQDIPVAKDVTALLAGWLKHHICGTDMQYVAFLKARAKNA